jgi:lipoprotein signal peptidase
VFNIADVAICAGAAALVYEMIKPEPPVLEPPAVEE